MQFLLLFLESEDDSYTETYVVTIMKIKYKNLISFTLTDESKKSRSTMTTDYPCELRYGNRPRGLQIEVRLWDNVREAHQKFLW